MFVHSKMNLIDFSKEDIINAYNDRLKDIQNLQSQLIKAKKEIKELNSKFQNFEASVSYTAPNQKRFSIH